MGMVRGYVVSGVIKINPPLFFLLFSFYRNAGYVMLPGRSLANGGNKHGY